MKSTFKANIQFPHGEYVPITQTPGDMPCTEGCLVSRGCVPHKTKKKIKSTFFSNFSYNASSLQKRHYSHSKTQLLHEAGSQTPKSRRSPTEAPDLIPYLAVKPWRRLSRRTAKVLIPQDLNARPEPERFLIILSSYRTPSHS